MLRRLSNAHLLGIAALMLLLSGVIAFAPTIRFVRGFFVGTLHPLEQFDSGETVEFIDPDPYSGYLLSMEVEERNPPLPEMDIAIATSDGGAPETSRIDRWNAMMGREYKQFLVIEPPEDGRLTIRIDTEENEDFLIYRRIDDVFEREIRAAAPLWITAAVPLMVMVVALGLILSRMMRESDKPSLDFRGEA